MKMSSRAGVFALILSVLGVLSSAVWDRPIQGGVVIVLAVFMLGVSFICEAIEKGMEK